MDKNLKHYNKSFYEEHIAWRKDYREVAKWVTNNITGITFGDIGCGNGFLIAELKKTGKTVWGVDGSDSFVNFVDKNIRPFVKRVDLSVRGELEKCDVTMCFEVAEHLDKKYADIFIDNIVSTQSGTILFTAATPGQGGTNHINLQPHSYWIDKFLKKGYLLDIFNTDKFRDDLAGKIPSLPWYLDNILIFKRLESFEIRQLQRDYVNSSSKKDVLVKRKQQIVKTKERQIAELENELGKILNSKRWRASSRIINFIRPR